MNEIKISYELRGKGSQITFVHGWMDTKKLWQSQAEKLASNSVLTFDLRGHGESDKPETDYSIPLFADDLFHLLNHLSIKKIILLGHSMGGMIAQQFYLEHPDKVNALILCSTASSGRELVESGLDIPAFINEIKLKGFRQAIIESASSMLNPSASISLIDLMLKENLKTSPHAAVSSLKAMLDWDSQQEIHDIKVPTLLVVGEEDTITPPTLTRKLNERIPSSKLVTIKKCGHMLFLEKPSELNNTIQNFLSTI